MTTQERFQQYKDLRSKYGMPASSAFRHMSATQAEFWDTVDYEETERNGYPRRRFILNGYDILVTIEHDDCGLSDLDGKFTSRYVDGAIRNPESLHDRNVHEWFVPFNSYKDHYKGLRDMHYGKQAAHELARHYVRQDLAAAHRSRYAYTVTASRNGIELGSSSLSGIDLGDDYKIDYLWEEAIEDIAQAIGEAKQALADLCSETAGSACA